MAADGVGPHAREGLLALRAAGDQQPAVVVEEVRGEGPVQRRLAVVHRADRRPLVVEQDDELFGHLGHGGHCRPGAP